MKASLVLLLALLAALCASVAMANVYTSDGLEIVDNLKVDEKADDLPVAAIESASQSKAESDSLNEAELGADLSVSGLSDAEAEEAMATNGAAFEQLAGESDSDADLDIDADADVDADADLDGDADADFELEAELEAEARGEAEADSEVEGDLDLEGDLAGEVTAEIEGEQEVVLDGANTVESVQEVIVDAESDKADVVVDADSLEVEPQNEVIISE